MEECGCMENGTAAFGARYLTPEMYLDYELKSIQLAFATYRGEMVGNHKCHVYTEDEKRAFYDVNRICLPGIMVICFRMKKWT